MKTIILIFLFAAVCFLSCFGETCTNSCINGNCNANGSCVCINNWFGENCTTFICEHSNPCLKKASCSLDGENDFICDCPEGFGGTLCEANEGFQPITVCLSNNCGDYGTCVIDPLTNTETCVCEAGYSGAGCTEEDNPCLSRGCKNGGTCILTVDWFDCICPEGYTKDTQCAGPVNNSCFYEPCGNHGICTLPVPHNGKDFICTCDQGYTGDFCDTIFNHCDDSPCMNDATCTQLSDNSSYWCTCPPYYAGKNCNISADPCKQCDSCWNNGTCVSNYTTISPGVYNYFTSCDCTDSYTGDHCDVDVDECDLYSPCDNEGTCTNTIGGYLCLCSAGYTGDNCQIEINECDNNPCKNNGICEDGLNMYTCNCSHTNYTGPQCELHRNQTCEIHGCQYNGQCEFSELLRKPVCTCKTGYDGEYCAYVYKPCSIGSCDSDGTMECIQNSTDTVCRCKPGYSGPTCSISIWNSCKHNHCLNNGTCNDVNGTFECLCLEGFSGRNCEIGVQQGECESDLQCYNDGQCIRIVEMEFCKCMTGWGGLDCSFDIDECYQTPCKNGGTCRNLEGSYECICQSEFEGFNCEQIRSNCEESICENGGSCVLGEGELSSSCLCPQGFEGKLCEKEVCPYTNCTSLANNGQCDTHCFNAACNYDGGEDPCYTKSGHDPWVNCTRTQCKTNYNNGYCDQDCNNANCLYDGTDCDTRLPECPQQRKNECERLVENGVCDQSCHTIECPYDINDCQKQLYLSNYLILEIASRRSVYFEGEERDQFLTTLGDLVHAKLELVSQTEITSPDITSGHYIVTSSDDNLGSYRYWRLVLRINIQFCVSSCPTTIEQVLNQIQAAYSSGQTQIGDFGIIDAISGDAPDDSSSPKDQTSKIIGSIVGGLACVVLVVVAIFVLGKRVRSDGGVRESFKKVIRVRGTFTIPGGSTPEPSETNLMSRGQSCSSDRHSGSIDTFDDPSPSSIRKSNTSLPRFQWSQMEAPVKNSTKEGATCVIGQRGKDDRKWTYLHCEAARMSADSRDLMNNSLADINAQGPAGLTPLMVAIMSEDRYHRNKMFPNGSVRSDSSSGSDYSEYDHMMVSQSPKFPRMFSTIVHSKPYDSKVPALIHAPHSNVNVTNDHGETALHLAVKHNREDYIHYLLIAKADPNIQDKWGKTPLHVAIGAVNDRAVQIILDGSRANLELKSHGGITPLMLAVKMGNNRALQLLIAKNVEITATDNEGRTAVHWAAMINSVDALRLLIKQGPDNVKDAPNHKGETALFLACREGSLGAVRHLLDCYANATLVDSLERSPLQIAYEKQNFEVIEILQQSSQGPLGGPSPPMYPMKPPHSVPNPMFGRNGSIKMEPAHMPTIIPSVTSAHDVYRFQNSLQSEGMTRCSSIEAELERLVNSTQYPPMMAYTSSMIYTSEQQPHPHSHPVVSQTHILNTSPSTVDGGHSPGHSIISPLGRGLSPGDSNTDHTFSPISSEVYPTNAHSSPQAGLTPYNNNTTVPSSSGQQLLTGSTPLQHLPATFVEGSSVIPASSGQSTSTIATCSNNSPMMGQTVSPNPTPLTMPQATINGGYSSLQLTADNHSPSAHYGFPSPPKEAGEFATYGTPYNGDNVNSVNSMTPSPEDGSSHQVDGSPQQYTTIQGQQYSYSTDPYQISLHPATIRTPHFSGLQTTFNQKESTV